ncbi:hypothetical protein HanLR1_Chr08g0280091 [Helianthus annuus]|nr:hypothetical protein HanLR1_Chr08g0280091 [Helianthus annuus]
MSHHKFYLYAHNKDSPAKIHSVSLVYSPTGTLTPPSSSPVSRTPSSPSLHHKDSTTDRMFQRRFRAAKPTRTSLLSLNTVGRRHWRRRRCGGGVASRGQ